MTFDPILAEMRFGTGLSPTVAPPRSVEQMLMRLAGPDQVAQRFPITRYDQQHEHMTRLSEARRAYRKAAGTPQENERNEVYRKAVKQGRQQRLYWLMQALARQAHTGDGLRERLVTFWDDHFTVRPSNVIMKQSLKPHTESFVRPHLTGRFADLLIAAATSPVMLSYLDQVISIGPDAPLQKRFKNSGRKRGLNENLAREILELHTLGVDGPYTQDDVRQLAELLTGLTLNKTFDTVYAPQRAEPGSERVLDKDYGGASGKLDDIHRVLTDLSVHPATAQHLSHKLAVHFLGDTPDPGAVRAMTDTWRDTGGDLLAVYQTMLSHPAAWDPTLTNVKPPLDFISSAVRALGMPPTLFAADNAAQVKLIHQVVWRPLKRMGQAYEEPPGPDGWPEEDEHWLTPQGLATRLEWSLTMPTVLMQSDLPDPREFVTTTLGPQPPEAVKFAARAAENRREGIALVLVSPAFQRR